MRNVATPGTSLEDLTNTFNPEAWINHLWESTIFAALAALLTVAFRRNRANVRYWLWFSASVKFLIPFALLVTLGSHLQWAPAAHDIAAKAFSITTARISQPFPDGWPSGPWSATSSPDRISWRGQTLLGLWAFGCLAITLIRLQMWRRIRIAVAASTSFEIRDAEIPLGVQLRTTPGLLEPGVVGLWRPILLLPAGIDQHLSPAQLNAVVAHELCHIRRRDNLTAAIHMIAEAVFWFHPVVWWIGARLVDERERACYYALLMARSDRRMGSQLRRAATDCDRAAESFEPGIGVGDGTLRCGFFGFAPGTNFGAGRGGIAFRGLTMAALAKVLVPMVHRSVSDQTGLTGYFDAEFDFIAELPIPPPPPGVPNPTFDAPFVSLFTVFPEQLGLKLDPRRGPVEVLVIDRAEQPTPN